MPWLTNVHVFHVWPAATDRHPLAAGQGSWRRYLSLLASSDRDHTALLEFVRDSDPSAFLEDAATLRSWLADTARQGGSGDPPSRPPIPDPL